MTMKKEIKYRLVNGLVIIVIGFIITVFFQQKSSRCGTLPSNAFPVVVDHKQKSSGPGIIPFGAFPRRFHIEGNRIVDEDGCEVVLRGLTPVDPVTLDYHTEIESGKYLLWDEEIFQEMSKWNADIVRLPISPYSWRTKGKEKVFEVINQAIEWASEYEMYVYIDFHGVGFPPTGEYKSKWNATSQEEILDFWDETSKYYKDNDVVAFYELFNEPTFSGNWPPTAESLESDWLDWKAFVETVVDTIRANDPDSVIIVGGLVWAHDISFVSNEPIARDNIVYAVHPYPATMWSPRSWEEAFGTIMSEHPVFVTEFGASGRTLLKVGEVQNYIRQYIDIEKYERELEACKCASEGCDCSLENECVCDPEEAKRLFKKLEDEIWSNPYTSSYLNRILAKYKDKIKTKLDNNKIGWNAWIFDFEWGRGLIEDRDYTPTEAGEFFRDWLSEKE